MRFARHALCTLVLCAPLAAAECKDEAALERCCTSFSFFLDNDVFLFNQARDEDRNYTMGVSLQWSGRWIRERGLAKPLYWVNALAPFRWITPDYANSPVRFHSLEFGNVAFTPDRLNTRQPIFNDRPYASLLFLDTSVQVVNNEGDAAFTRELSIGMLGLSISERFQRWLHKKVQDSPAEPPFPPEGWDNQISDGGEPTARYVARWQWAPLIKPHRLDFQWIAEGNIGYYTNVGGGAALRIGRIHSPWWQFNAAPISESGFRAMSDPPSATVSATASAPVASESAASRGSSCASSAEGRYELYGWGGSMARVWGYNVLLQGQLRDSVVTVPARNVERLVYEYSVGATAGACLGNRWHRVTVIYARRSPEFDGPLRRYHSWGGIYYSAAIQPR